MLMIVSPYSLVRRHQPPRTAGRETRMGRTGREMERVIKEGFVGGVVVVWRRTRLATVTILVIARILEPASNGSYKQAQSNTELRLIMLTFHHPHLAQPDPHPYHTPHHPPPIRLSNHLAHSGRALSPPTPCDKQPLELLGSLAVDTGCGFSCDLEGAWEGSGDRVGP